MDWSWTSLGGMGLGTAIAIYFIIWWTMIFITLPFRMRTQLDTGHVVEATEPSAPVRPQLGRRLWWNTLLSLGVFFLYWLVFYGFGLSVDDLPEFIPIRNPD
ncbi:MAG: DUF1467 family protein [Ahrensia sp.]|nr:DUF1467 family protein [Ahrensia sp.]